MMLVRIGLNWGLLRRVAISTLMVIVASSLASLRVAVMKPGTAANCCIMACIWAILLLFIMPAPIMAPLMGEFPPACLRVLGSIVDTSHFPTIFFWLLVYMSALSPI